MGPSRPDGGYAALTCGSVVIRCTECGTAMGLATSELVQSCSDCGLSSRYGGICFVGLDDDAADSASEADDGATARNSWYPRVSAHQGQRVGMTVLNTASQHATCLAW